MKGRIARIHNCRDGLDNPSTMSQVWVVEAEDGSQHILSVKIGQQIEFNPCDDLKIRQLQTEKTSSQKTKIRSPGLGKKRKVSKKIRK